MSKSNSEMTANDVIGIVKFLNQNIVEVIIDGGWGVDALLGRQTRKHEDLDVAVMHKDVPKIRALLEEIGYREVPRDDTWECNFVLGDDKGHLVDIHSCTFDEAGNNIFGVKYPYESLNGTGSINGIAFRCISPEWMIKFHIGYKLNKIDYHDIKLLCKQFGIVIPEEYGEFIRNDDQS
jgi:lincosamide nucleotidyltransferase A/C/D/E